VQIEGAEIKFAEVPQAVSADAREVSISSAGAGNWSAAIGLKESWSLSEVRIGPATL